jgi:hypothetical protein
VSRGLLAASPLALALLLYAALALPLRARTERTRDAFTQARRDRQQAQSQLLPLERRERIRRQAEAAFAEAAAREGGAAAAIRRSVLATLGESAASAVRLAVRAGASGPTLRVSASAPYAEGLRVAGALARPQTGLVLQHVSIEPSRDDRRQVGVQVEARAFSADP